MITNNLDSVLLETTRPCFDINATEERWQSILQCKDDYLNNRIKDLHSKNCITHEIATSWMKSRERGINPYTIPCVIPRSEELDVARRKQECLINITKSFITPSIEQLIINGYILALIDGSGYCLLNKNRALERDNGLFLMSSSTGFLSTEETFGTCAHEFCFRLKKPVQLLGPENYCIPLQNRTTSAAPIMNENHDVVAALVLLNPPLTYPFDVQIINSLNLQSMCIVTSIAATIESQFKLKNARIECKFAHNVAKEKTNELELVKFNIDNIDSTLMALVACCNDGIVVIDKRGMIIRTNHEAMKILNISSEELGSVNIVDFFDKNSSVMTFAERGEAFTVEENLKVGTGNRQLYRLCVNPIKTQYTKKLELILIKLVACSKNTSKSANYSGTATAPYKFANILGESHAIKTAIAQAQRFASSSENILLIGESGTGKEFFAQAIHNCSRPQGPFMAINCAAFPRELIGSELFGYDGGSFTGAERRGRQGKIEMANGGTLFLDEIGDMPLELQAILLRVLQDKKVMRIGGNKYSDVDFRLVAATNKDLDKMVMENKFREDLFYRLSVLSITIPPLRERGQDIENLSNIFVENYCLRQKRSIPEITPEAKSVLNKYKWPGNVRQLQNALHHAVNTSDNDIILPDNLPPYLLRNYSEIALNDFYKLINENQILSLQTIEMLTIEAALKQANNHVADAAKMVGLSAPTLYRKLKEYKILHGDVTRDNKSV